MTNYYIPLLLLAVIISLIHLGFLSKRYAYKLTPYILGKKADWNPKVDRLKLILSSTFYFAPVIFIKVVKETNFTNQYINYFILFFLIFITSFCFWFDIKKVSKLRESNSTEKSYNVDIKFNANKLEVAFNKLLQDLKNRSFYDSINRKFNLREYKITPLQSFQILILYFEKEYKLNQNTKKQHIYNLFNSYFDMEGQILTSKNWCDYSELIQQGYEKGNIHIRKHQFYNDLLKLDKKNH
ncbi:hypothetical protein [Tenacibaculum sp. A30]|uniref:hypothetical protein n=1 Tax=Tenacibaculum sp. A30 TaxID=3442644 RepID=UPI003EB9F1C7